MARGLRGIVENKEVDDIEGEEESETFFNKMDRFKNKFKLGSHHKMERFSIMLGVSLLCLTLCTGVAFIKNQIDMANAITNQSSYTRDLEFSLSKEQGEVVGVFGNVEGTDRIVLIKFNNPANMSTTAKNYQLFITGAKKPLKYQPETSFSIFGATGYCMLRFQQDDPFPNEIMKITIRSNSTLTETAEPSGDNEDGSFSKFDQAQLMANLGAKNITVVDDMKTGETDPVKLYVGLVANTKDQEIHDRVKAITKDMGTLLSRKIEYEDRIKSYNYVVPIEPVVMRGDYIDENGVLQSQNDVVLAYDFDYDTKTIKDGYLKQVITNMKDYNTYMRDHNESSVDKTVLARKTEREVVVPIKSAVSSVNGSELKFDSVVTGTSASADVAVKDAYQSLSGVWSSYITQKRELQITTAREFLVLDADVQSQTSGFNTVTDKDKSDHDIDYVFYY